MHKYNKGLISIKNDPYCICLPNLNLDKCKDVDAKRKERLESQCRRYGFSDNETWSLDYTTYVWVYMHLKMFLDIGGKTVVLEDPNITEFLLKDLRKVGCPEELTTLPEIINYICELIEKVDNITHGFSSLEEEQEANKLLTKAMMIYAVILPTLSW